MGADPLTQPLPEGGEEHEENCFILPPLPREGERLGEGAS